MAGSPATKRLIAGVCFFTALTALLWLSYRAAFAAPFYLDSRLHLLLKPQAHMVQLTPEAVREAAHMGRDGRLYRPVAMVSLALTHYAFGLAPPAYRVGNLAIHLGAAGALLFLFLEILASPRVRRSAPWCSERAFAVALAAVAVWALHPVQTNVVSYVVQRMTSLCGLFTFLALAAWLRARRRGGFSWGWGGVSAVAGVLALGSKETAVVLPLLIALVEWLLVETPAGGSTRRRVAWAGGVLAASVLIPAAIGAPRYWSLFAELSAARGWTPIQRLLTQVRIQSDYLTLLVCPDPRLLVLDADVPLSTGLLSPPQTLLMVVLVAALLGVGFHLRRRAPLASFCILFFFAAQVVEGTILPLELYFEHRLYVPSALLWLGVVSGLGRAARGGAARRAAVALLCGVFALAEVAATQVRNGTWASPLRMGADAVAKAPAKARPRLNFGYELRVNGYLDGAEEQLKKALDLGADRRQVLLNLAGIAYAREQYPRAREYLAGALKAAAAPAEILEVQQEWAAVELAAGKPAEAFALLKKTLRTDPGNPRSLRLLGELLLRGGDSAQAEKVLSAAVRGDPALADAWYALGNIALERRECELAGQRFAAALRGDPSHEGALTSIPLAEECLRAASP